MFGVVKMKILLGLLLICSYFQEFLFRVIACVLKYVGIKRGSEGG